MKYLKLLITILFLQASCLAQTSRSLQKFDAKYTGLVNAYNTNDSVLYGKFYAAVNSNPDIIAANVKKTKHEFSFTGQVELMQVKTLSSKETELTFKTNDYGAWWTYLWVADSLGNFKEHHMRPIRLQSEFLGTVTHSREEVLDRTNAYIEKLTQKKVFAGNVLIAQNNRIIYSKSFGNNPQGKPNTVNQQFDLASMGKLFTTVSMLQLVDQRKLSLDDSIGKLMPQLTNKALFPITIRQLLTHTSGMGDYFEDPLFDPFNGKKITSADALPIVEKDKPLFAPGKDFRYSNTGFELLGLVIKKVSGLSLATYVQNNIFKRADMTNSVVGVGSGGGLSTVTDLYNFANALKSNKLLTLALTSYLETYHTKNWGLGQEYQELGNEVITGHSGGFVGVCTELNMYKNNGYTVVILSNTEPPYGHYISDKIKELLVTK